jgi:hypothetical protein
LFNSGGLKHMKIPPFFTGLTPGQPCYRLIK